MPRILIKSVSIVALCAGAVAGCASVPRRAALPADGSAPQPRTLAQALQLDPIVPPERHTPASESRGKPQLDSAVAVANDKPSNDRQWIPEHRLLASAEFDGDRATIHNIRNAEFFSYRDCLVDYYDKSYDLSKLRTVDFIMIPFNDARYLAHTMLTFGFENGDYLGVSVEVRLEQGESYDAAIGLFNQFELIYVVADERDLIRVRTEYRDVDVLIYRTKATPEQARRLFVDIMRRVNKLKDEPEFYDTLSNNCTTNIARHINTLAPGSVPHDFRVLLPGYADNLAYELGLIDNSLPFAEVRRRARVNDLALRYKGDPHFSQRIRGEQVR
ncbi:MAG TPA: DUF4105 domain-containing protein [Pirellulaceae bacterium]|nr:DUF4105 domain-containing protein [Pirellulaceae bacterium]